MKFIHQLFIRAGAFQSIEILALYVFNQSKLKPDAVVRYAAADDCRDLRKPRHARCTHPALPCDQLVAHFKSGRRLHFPLGDQHRL